MSLMLVATAAFAAEPLVEELRVNYAYTRNNLVRIAAKMPAEFYSFKPVNEVETFAVRVAHISNANLRVCAGLLGETPKPVNSPDKAVMVAAIEESFKTCDRVLDQLTDAKALETIAPLGGPPLPKGSMRTRLFTLYNMLRHSNEVYGNMCVYLRLKGIVPPSSE
jgi:hypothetical protein